MTKSKQCSSDPIGDYCKLFQLRINLLIGECIFAIIEDVLQECERQENCGGHIP